MTGTRQHLGHAEEAEADVLVVRDLIAGQGCREDVEISIEVDIGDLDRIGPESRVVDDLARAEIAPPGAREPTDGIVAEGRVDNVDGTVAIDVRQSQVPQVVRARGDDVRGPERASAEILEPHDPIVRARPHDEIEHAVSI